MEKLENILEKHEIQPTAMRILVLKKLQQTEHALSLNELEDLFEQADKSTLYRTLKTFEDNHLVHSIEDGTGALKYALSESRTGSKLGKSHVHFHCNNCGQTVCLEDTESPELSLPENFIAEEANIIVKGLCDRCS